MNCDYWWSLCSWIASSHLPSTSTLEMLNGKDHIYTCIMRWAAEICSKGGLIFFWNTKKGVRIPIFPQKGILVVFSHKHLSVQSSMLKIVAGWRCETMVVQRDFVNFMCVISHDSSSKPVPTLEGLFEVNVIEMFLSV